MTTHRIGTRQEWLAERLDLLVAEKELTRQSDALARRRQALPWVRVEKDYAFETDRGPGTLGELFRGRSQLLVYHFMFGPDYTVGCPSCSAIADGFNGFAAHLAHHDVLLTAVSLAPLEKLQAFKRRMGWTFPWASAVGGEFNFDFCASFTEEQQRAGIEYNFTREPSMQWNNGDTEFESATTCGVDTPAYLRQRPGLSAFIREGDAIYHTYSTYSRGLDGLCGMYQWLDRAPLGRNESNGIWWKHHDLYDTEESGSPACCHQPAEAAK